jgi:hypothetical protein
MSEKTISRYCPFKSSDFVISKAAIFPGGFVRVNGRTYGLQPKFLRMRELHGLLYYLIYGYAGQPNLDQAQALGMHRSRPYLVKG